MPVVDPEKARELLNYIDKNFGNIKIAYKDEPFKNNLMYLFYAFVCFMNIFIKDYRYKFMNKYTTVCGDYIYFSSRVKHPASEFNMSYSTYIILRHEVIHLIQNKRSFFYKFNYLFLLPSVFTMRSVYEYEAYEETLVAIFELYGKIEDEDIELIASNFYRSMYLWMNPFKGKILARLKSSRGKVISGEKRSAYLSHPTKKF